MCECGSLKTTFEERIIELRTLQMKHIKTMMLKRTLCRVPINEFEWIKNLDEIINYHEFLKYKKEKEKKRLKIGGIK